DGTTYALRLDGAPANADFQQFLADLTAAARATSMQPSRFNAFAMAVLGNGYSPAKAVQLKASFDAWVKQFGEFMDKSLPTTPWGPGRLDAFGMIFNRVAGRDLGLDANFKVADAPVSYPFCGMRPSRITRNGMAAYQTGSIFRDWDAIPGKSTGSSPTSNPKRASSVLTTARIPQTSPVCKRLKKKSWRLNRQHGRATSGPLRANCSPAARNCMTPTAVAAM